MSSPTRVLLASLLAVRYEHVQRLNLQSANGAMVTYSKSYAHHDKKRTEMDSEMDLCKHTLAARNCVLKQIYR